MNEIEDDRNWNISWKLPGYQSQNTEESTPRAGHSKRSLMGWQGERHVEPPAEEDETADPSNGQSSYEGIGNQQE